MMRKQKADVRLGIFQLDYKLYIKDIIGTFTVRAVRSSRGDSRGDERSCHLTGRLTPVTWLSLTQPLSLSPASLLHLFPATSSLSTHSMT